MISVFLLSHRHNYTMSIFEKLNKITPNAYYVTTKIVGIIHGKETIRKNNILNYTNNPLNHIVMDETYYYGNAKYINRILDTYKRHSESSANIIVPFVYNSKLDHSRLIDLDNRKIKYFFYSYQYDGKGRKEYSISEVRVTDFNKHIIEVESLNNVDEFLSQLIRKTKMNIILRNDKR